MDLAGWDWLLLGSEHSQAQAEHDARHGPLSILAVHLGVKSGSHY